MIDPSAIAAQVPELRPLIEQQDPPWAFYRSANLAMPITVTCARFYFTNGAWYADALHVGLREVGACRTRWRGPGSLVEPMWTFTGELAEAVNRVMQRPNAEDP
ncbi:hypothetical protein GCM10010174_56170 [Kutzneria viridogrisea]|uniref:Uncharacterized protein n=1 Tax=Kutzneria viridogrisea TaxID=47990 RepID=A0ABR6BKV0_9PSEU|nr:hypothetical protein [Kutzneria viridogrisea]